MTEALLFVLVVVQNVILVYFFLINSFYLFFMILSGIGMRNYRIMTTYVSLKDIFNTPFIKPISVITPAYNEEKNIIESVKSLLSLEYPKYEVIVVNDGSTDSTFKILSEAFSLKKTARVFRKNIETALIKDIYVSDVEPKLIVVDKVHGMKADALNAGLNIARYPLFCTVDSDSVLERDSLLKMVRPFLEDPERVVGAGGIVRLSNGSIIEAGRVVEVKMPRNLFARFQIIEYFRAFLGGRLALSMLRSILIISGAFGMFRKDIVLECGGYRTDAVCEDMDLVVRMQRHLHLKRIPYRFRFIPDPICWTEGPETLKDLTRQRNRWHRGLIESLTHNLRMFFNPRFGITGMFAMPFYVIFEMLGPLIELTGYVIFAVYAVMGKISYPFAVMIFFLAVVYGIFISLIAILFSEFSSYRYPRLSDIIIITIFGFLENILYRQYLALVRSRAFLDYLLGKKHWGKMKRSGFNNKKS